MKTVSPFEVFRVMCERGMKIRLAPLDNITHMQLTKKGTRITLGADSEAILDISEHKVCGGFLMADVQQFEQVKKELESIG